MGGSNENRAKTTGHRSEDVRVEFFYPLLLLSDLCDNYISHLRHFAGSRFSDPGTADSALSLEDADSVPELVCVAVHRELFKVLSSY